MGTSRSIPGPRCCISARTRRAASSRRASRPGILREYLPRPGFGAPQGNGCTQLHELRLAADRQQLRRAHGALHRGAQRDARSSSTRRRRRRSRTTSCSTASSAGSRPRRRRRSSSTASSADVLQQLPMEFAVEAQKLIAISLEGSVGLTPLCFSFSRPRQQVARRSRGRMRGDAASFPTPR